MNVAGIDIGTSGVKCSVYREDGTLIARSVKNYSYEKNVIGYSLNPEAVWISTRETLAQVAEKCEGDIDGIAVSCIGEACVLLDDNNMPLAPSILYNDPRGMEEGKEFNRRFGADSIFEETGVYSNGTYSLAKLKWISEHEKYFQRVQKIFMFEDFITFYLTGERVISYSLASRSMGLNVHSKKWIQKYFDFAGVDISMISAVAPSGMYIGKIRPHLAEEMRINPEMKVFVGGHDQSCCVLGGGLTDYQTAVNVSGSGDTISFLMRSPDVDASLGAKGYCNCPCSLPDAYLTYGLCSMSGTMLSWFRDQLWKGNQHGFYHDMENILKDTATKVTIFPGFSSIGTPCFRLDTTGAIDSLTLNTKPEDIYLAMLESIAFSLRHDIDELNSVHCSFNSVRIVGGGAQSDIWNQMKADVWDKQIEMIDSRQSGAVGCCILSAAGLGLYKTIEEAAHSFVHVKKTYEPNREKRHYYDEKYSKYKELFAIKMDMLKSYHEERNNYETD